MSFLCSVKVVQGECIFEPQTEIESMLQRTLPTERLKLRAVNDVRVRFIRMNSAPSERAFLILDVYIPLSPSFCILTFLMTYRGTEGCVLQE